MQSAREELNLGEDKIKLKGKMMECLGEGRIVVHPAVESVIMKAVFYCHPGFCFRQVLCSFQNSDLIDIRNNH